MTRVLTPVVAWAVLRLVTLPPTVSAFSSDACGPYVPYMGAEYTGAPGNHFGDSSRGLFFPSLKLGEVTGDSSTSDEIATEGISVDGAVPSSPSDGRAGDEQRGFLTKAIGQYLDKFGNEIRILCWSDDMCANNADGRTSCYRGRCVECLTSSDCTDLSAPVCDTLTRTCVQCSSTQDCATGVCSSNKVCVECTSNSRCAGRGTYIDFMCSTYGGNAREQLLMNTCTECVVNSDCPYRMLCSGNVCTCTSDAQCDGSQPFCYEGRCQACPGSTALGHGVCSEVYSGGTCQLRESTSEVYRCVECEAASDCGGAACVDGSCSCVSNGCAQGLYCDKSTEKCVECLRDAHCTDPSAPYCGPMGQCVQCTGTDVTCRKETTLGMVACNAPYGTCEPLCGSDADCLMDTRPYCDPSSSRCAVCLSDDNCPSSAPYCRERRCVQCQTPGSSEDCEAGMVCNELNLCAACHSNEECPRDRPICSTDMRSCVTCDDEAGLYCPRERPICQSGQCLGCQYDSDCGSVLRCDPKSNRCELCLHHDDCASIYGDSRPYCSQGTCQECRGDKDCSYQFPHCNSGGSCVQCSASVQCDNGGICDLVSGRCVDCLDDSQCPNALPHCTKGRCVECTGDDDCPFGSCFDGMCKECDITTTTCTSVVQKYYQSCSPYLSCESYVEFGSMATVLSVDAYGET